MIGKTLGTPGTRRTTEQNTHSAEGREVTQMTRGASKRTSVNDLDEATQRDDYEIVALWQDIALFAVDNLDWNVMTAMVDATDSVIEERAIQGEPLSIDAEDAVREMADAAIARIMMLAADTLNRVES